MFNLLQRVGTTDFCQYRILIQKLLTVSSQRQGHFFQMLPHLCLPEKYDPKQVLVSFAPNKLLHKYEVGMNLPANLYLVDNESTVFTFALLSENWERHPFSPNLGNPFREVRFSRVASKKSSSHHDFMNHDFLG